MFMWVLVFSLLFPPEGKVKISGKGFPPYKTTEVQVHKVKQDGKGFPVYKRYEDRLCGKVCSGR